MLAGLLGYGVAAYAYDVLWRPAQAAHAARAYARVRGKPVLNVGAGTPGSSVRVALAGPTAWGDVNCDLNGRAAPGSGGVCFCDAHRLPFPDQHFAAAIASHVIEHVEDPQGALGELARVAERVYVLTPVWWAPHTWLHPGHRWYRRDDGSFMPLVAGPARSSARPGALMRMPVVALGRPCRCEAVAASGARCLADATHIVTGTPDVFVCELHLASEIVDPELQYVLRVRYPAPTPALSPRASKK